MAFMDFLKKGGEKKEKDIFDSPPPPPLPDMPEKIPSGPEPMMEQPVPPLAQEPMPQTPEPAPPKEDNFPTPPSPEMPPETLHGYPPVHEEHHAPQPVVHHKPVVHDEPKMEPPPMPPRDKKPIPKMKKATHDVFRKEYKEGLMEKHTKGPLYMKVHNFKRTNEKINEIKTKVKEADDTLIRLVDIESYKDTEYEKWNKIMKELQRKFIVIDKKLFNLKE